jgi:hypothetical protein
MRWLGKAGTSGWSRTSVALAITVCLAASASGALVSSSQASTTVPRITLSPTLGPPGSSATVKGTGFTPSASVTVTFDGFNAASGSTNSSGSFTITIAVRHEPAGSYTVRAADSKGRAASAPFRVTPFMNVSPLTVTPNDNLCNQIHVSVPSVVSVTTAGFKAGASLAVTMDSTRVATLTANAWGTANGKFTVPSQTPGNRTIQVTDAATGMNRRRVVFVESFSCWSATATSKHIDWAWDGVAWDAGVPVSLILRKPNGSRVTLHRVTSGARGGFGIYRWTGICRPTGTYPITVTGRSQGHTITIAAGNLKILRGC